MTKAEREAIEAVQREHPALTAQQSTCLVELRRSGRVQVAPYHPETWRRAYRALAAHGLAMLDERDNGYIVARIVLAGEAS